MSEQLSRRRLLQTATGIFTPLALLFIGILIWQSHEILQDLFAELDLAWLTLSIVLWLSLYALSPLFTRQILRSLGGAESYTSLLHIFIARLPAKYLPGGIWQTVARAYDLSNRGISSKHLTQLLAYELGMPLLAALATGLFLLATSGAESAIGTDLAWTVATACLGGLLLAPLASRFAPGRLTPVGRAHYYSATGIILLYWVLAGLSFAAFVLALDIEGFVAGIWGLAGAYSVSWSAGYLTVFAPQGLGVMEYTAQRIIDFPVNAAAGVSIVFCFRLLVACIDITAWALQLMSARLRDRPGQ